MARKLTFAQVLAGAADLLASGDHWIRDYTAMRVDRDSQGNTLYSRRLATDDDATMWGGTGAIFKIGMGAGLTTQQCWAVQEIAARYVGAGRWFSDWAWELRRTKDEVITALRGAAELAATEAQAA